MGYLHLLVSIVLVLSALARDLKWSDRRERDFPTQALEGSDVEIDRLRDSLYVSNNRVGDLEREPDDRCGA